MTATAHGGPADWRYVAVEMSGQVATVRFDRKDGVNALSLRAIEELTAAAEWVRNHPDIYAVALVGGARGFSAGRDLRDPELNGLDDRPLLHRRHIAGAGGRMCKAWASLEPFTACGIEGFAIGGGLALAVSTDWRAVGRSAHFRAPEAALGLSMSWGAVPRLVNLIGPARTKQLLIHGNDRVDAESAHAWGLAQAVVDDGGAMAAAVEAATKAAATPPVAARMIKKAVDAYASALADAVIHMDADQVLLAETGKDHVEAVEAFFEKRDPNFTGA